MKVQCLNHYTTRPHDTEHEILYNMLGVVTHPVSSTSSWWTSRSFVESISKPSTTSTKSPLITMEITTTSAESTAAESPTTSTSPSHYLILWWPLSKNSSTTAGKSAPAHWAATHWPRTAHHCPWSHIWRTTSQQWWFLCRCWATGHCHACNLVSNCLGTGCWVKARINTNTHQGWDSCRVTGIATAASHTPAISTTYIHHLINIDDKHKETTGLVSFFLCTCSILTTSQVGMRLSRNFVNMYTISCKRLHKYGSQQAKANGFQLQQWVTANICLWWQLGRL